jgi:hypothetical protein
MKNYSSPYVHETGHASAKPLAAIALGALVFGAALVGPALIAGPGDTAATSVTNVVAAPTP